MKADWHHEKLMLHISQSAGGAQGGDIWSFPSGRWMVGWQLMCLSAENNDLDCSMWKISFYHCTGILYMLLPTDLYINTGFLGWPKPCRDFCRWIGSYNHHISLFICIFQFCPVIHFHIETQTSDMLHLSVRSQNFTKIYRVKVHVAVLSKWTSLLLYPNSLLSAFIGGRLTSLFSSLVHTSTIGRRINQVECKTWNIWFFFCWFNERDAHSLLSAGLWQNIIFIPWIHHKSIS